MRHRLFIPAATALLFALAACTQDELAGDNRLPEVEYPVVIRATGLSVETTPLAAPSTLSRIHIYAMKQSVLTAFYTPPEITGTIADVLHEHGIRPDRVLEPSAGVGAFGDAVLENRPDADIIAFEKDLMTGKIDVYKRQVIEPAVHLRVADKPPVTQ